MNTVAVKSAALLCVVSTALFTGSGCTSSNRPAASSSMGTPTSTTPATTTTVSRTSTTTTTTTTTTTPIAAAIDRVEIQTDGTNRVGPDLFQATPEVTHVQFGWISYSGGTEVTENKCTVVSVMTGPNGFSHKVRDADCTAEIKAITKMWEVGPGNYTIEITVTGPDGGEPIKATKTFQVLSPGQ